MADENVQPTHAQMIAEMQQSGFTPPQAVSADISHAQMIAEMKQAGFAPDSPLLKASEHPYIKGALDYLPAAGSVVGGIGGATLGSVVPGAGTVGGEVVGAAGGGAVGSLAKDALNEWLFGEKKSAGDMAKSAGIEGAIGGVSQGVGAALGAGAKAIAATRLGGAAIDTAGNLLAGAGETVFRIPAPVIKRYAVAAAEIAKLSKGANGDIAAASDEVKAGFAKSLDGFRSEMNQKVGTALAASDEKVSSAPIVEALEKSKGRLNPKLDADAAQLNSINKQIEQVKRMEVTRVGTYGTERTGEITVQDAHALKQSFQDTATTAYRDAGASSTGSAVANSAKSAAAVTRRLVNKAVPEVAEANNQLAFLHTVEDNMNRSLIKQGATESGLVAAGKGANARNARALQKLGEITDKDFLGPAQNLGAMSAMDSAGMQLKRAGIGAAVGASVGYEVGGEHGAIAGGTLGAAVTSPFVLKKGMDAFRGASGMLGSAAGSAVGEQTLGQAVVHGSGGVAAIRRNQP